MAELLEWIDVADSQSIENASEQQQAALDMLPKLEKFCAENSLSARNIEVLSEMLGRKMATRPIA